MKAISILFSLFLLLPNIFCGITVKDIKGDVFAINEKGEKVTLKKGDTIERGYSILTSTSSYVEIILDEIGVVALYENTKFVMEKSTSSSFVSIIDRIFGVKELNATENESIFDYLYGKALFVLKSLGEMKYNVKTIQAVCGVRGTSFLINSTDKLSEVGVYKGEVEVIKGDIKKVIKRNQTAYITETDIKIENRLSKIAERERNRALKIERYFERIREKLEKRNRELDKKLDRN